MYVTIRVRQPTDPEAAPRRAPLDLRDALDAVGLTIEPMHPGSRDQELARWFYVDVADPERAHALTGHLRELASVDAVYVKSPEGPP